MVFDPVSGRQDVIVNIPEAQLHRLGGKSGIKTVAANQESVEQLFFNCCQKDSSKGSPVLRDPAFRRALSYAADKERLVKLAFSGFGAPGTTVVPPGYTAFP